MKILLSGEGPTDLGACTNAQGRCSGADLRIGPMAVLLSQRMAGRLGYDVIDYPDALDLITETALCDYAKTHATGRLRPARSQKQAAETGYYRANAQALGHLAGCSDGTCSSPATLWEDKWQSICNGFASADFVGGMPMLPKPKSEAWLIAAASPTLHHCKPLESLPGNDRSPSSAKERLDATMGRHLSGEELADWLRGHPIDDAQAARMGTMPSFRQFTEALDKALSGVLRDDWRTRHAPT
jgi:hypothetical protein